MDEKVSNITLLRVNVLCFVMSDLIIQQLTEVKPGDSKSPTEEDKAAIMKEARLMVQETRARTCRAQREIAHKEQENAHTCETVSIILFLQPIE